MAKLIGKIGAKVVDIGTSKQHREYFIETAPNQRRKIVVEGEHPRDQPTLAKLLGKRCEVDGENYQGRFIIVSIQELPEALVPRKK